MNDVEPRHAAVHSSPTYPRVGTVLVAVKDASRRWWPSAILDRDCARRQRNSRSGQRNGPQPNKETHGRLDTPAEIRERAIAVFRESAGPQLCDPGRPF